IISCNASPDAHVPEGKCYTIADYNISFPGLMKQLSNWRTGPGVLSGWTSAGRPRSGLIPLKAG
ncbi:TPA: hypothetical protein ACJ2XU_005625, partial [Klebsiella pneumoniae]